MATRTGRRGGLPDICETTVAQGHLVLTPGPRGLVEIHMDIGTGGLGHTTGHHTGVGHLDGMATGTGVRGRGHGERIEGIGNGGGWGLRVGGHDTKVVGYGSIPTLGSKSIFRRTTVKRSTENCEKRTIFRRTTVKRSTEN